MNVERVLAARGVGSPLALLKQRRYYQWSVWKIKGLGGGDGAPSIAAGLIFGMGNRGDDEVVWALSEKDGKEFWATRLGPAFKQAWPQGKEGPGTDD